MSRNYLLHVLAILACAIAAMNFLAISFHLYWMFWWYDIILHFLGGIFVGLLVLWLRFFSGYLGTSRIPSTTSVLFFVVVATLSIGIGWEVFERVLGDTWSLEGYWLDTALDVILDFLGSLVAFGFFKSNQ